MLLVTASDYQDYHGEDIPSDEFLRYAARASEAVDAATGGRIVRAGGPAALSEYEQAQVKLACCAQAEYLFLQGADAALDGVATGGYQIGKTYLYANSNSSASGRLAGGLCRKAWHALAAAGLLDAGVALC